MRIVTLLLCLLLAAPVCAGPVVDALYALEDPAQRAALLTELKERADAGDARAQYWLGRAYHDLLPIDQRDFPAARGWLERAEANGHAGAAVMLGRIHERGFTVPADRAQAAVHYQRAFELGAAAAAFDLARLAFAQEPRDDVAIARWLDAGARGGHPGSMMLLARLHASGTVVAADAVEALKWAILAREAGGGAAALELLREIAAQVPETGHEEARTRARAWLEAQ